MGSLELIIGPMFAGKSCELFRKIRILKVLNKKYIVIKPTIDTRNNSNIIVSHNFDKENCIALKNLDDILYIMSDTDFSAIDTIFIDEGQFFTDLKDTVLNLVEKYNKNVIISGLDGDSKRNHFGQIIDLIPLADKYEKFTAMCLKCKDGTPGIFSHCINTMEDQVLIGAGEHYISVCRKHYILLNDINK